MNETEFDIAIVGGGCLGSSIAFELSRLGFRNLVLLDHGRHTVSATTHSGGMIRTFHENSNHVEMSISTVEILKRYQDKGILTEQTQPNGSLYFFDQKRFKNYESNLKLMATRQIPFEVLTAQQGESRFPEINWLTSQSAIYEPLAFHLSPSRFSNELLKASVKVGLRLIDNFEVERICFFKNRYRIFSNGQTSGTLITAKTLILAGGARLLPQLKELGICHSLTTKILKHFQTTKLSGDWNLPSYFDRETLEYGRLGNGPSLLLSDLNTQRFPGVAWKKTNFTEICAADCYAPGRMGFAGYLLGHPRLLLATGWGGTAFKFSLDIGQQIGRILKNEQNERGLAYA